jgi:SAM-dependent methyltransferase
MRLHAPRFFSSLLAVSLSPTRALTHSLTRSATNSATTSSTPPLTHSLTAPVIATDLFSSWAREGRDEVMASGHLPAVQEMLSLAHPLYPKYQVSEGVSEGVSECVSEGYRFLDVGCGNGWVVRAEAGRAGCAVAAGVDGARDMVRKAEALALKALAPGTTSSSSSGECSSGSSNNGARQEFYHSDLLEFHPSSKFDVAFSMEVMYYLSEDQVAAMLASLSNNIIEKNGLFVFGIDHYLGERVSECILVVLQRIFLALLLLLLLLK